MSDPYVIEKLRGEPHLYLTDGEPAFFGVAVQDVLDAYDTIASERDAAAKVRTLWKGQYVEAIDRLKETREQRDAFEQMADMWKSHADSIVAELATTRAEREALLRDTARLDWLEAQTEVGPFDPHFPELARRWLQVTGYQTTLREIIDAALSERP